MYCKTAEERARETQTAPRFLADVMFLPQPVLGLLPEHRAVRGRFGGQPLVLCWCLTGVNTGLLGGTGVLFTAVGNVTLC